MNKRHTWGTPLKDLKGEALERWVTYHDNADIKVRSERAHRNEMKNCEKEGKADPTHHRGSQYSLRRAKRLQAELGRMPTAAEIFLDMHGKTDHEGTTFMTRKDQAIWDAYQKEQDNLETAPDATEVDTNQIFFKVVLGYKKGSVYGVGNEHGIYL